MIFPLFLASLSLVLSCSPRSPEVPRSVRDYLYFSLKLAISCFSLPYYRARQPRQTASAVLQIAVPASVLVRYFLKSSTSPTWLSDDCADKHLGHLIGRVSEVTSPLLSSGIYFKLMWPEHRQCRQKKSYLELPLRLSMVSQWHPHKQPLCV